MAATVYAICNQKGGCAKTVTSVNFGIGLARMGKKVLLIDMDAQGSMTASLGFQQPDKLEVTLATILFSIINDIPLPDGFGILHHEEGVDLLPANIELSGMEVTLVNTMSRETILREFLKEVTESYDAIVLDTMPSLGMLTINALAAADQVIIPTASQYYDANPDKTREGELVSSYMCQPETAAAEFEAAKIIYESVTGRSQPKDRDVTMYRVMQSFKPGEVTPETANRIGYELAMEFTKGQHQFVVYTHEDKAHIHNHIEINSTNLECNGKFKNVKDSVKVLRRLNDRICLANGLSIPEPKQERSLSQGEKGAVQNGRSFKERLRHTIDSKLPGCKSFEEFLSRMREEGYEVKYRGKSLEFRAPGQERFTRSFRLGEEYTEQRLRERATGKDGRAAIGQGQRENRSHGNQHRIGTQNMGRQVNLLVDIQAKLQEGKGKGYEQWAKVFNLKEAAKTVNFLTEKGVADYGELEARAESAGQRFDSLSARIKQLEGRMTQKAQLKMHIINYAKTRDIYAAYKKARDKEGFRKLHKDEIEKHESAKVAFDAVKGEKIPKVADLSKEYAALLAEKNECYEEYKAAREEDDRIPDRKDEC